MEVDGEEIIEEIIEETIEEASEERAGNIIPLGFSHSDDMETLAGMSEHFSQTMRPILRMYNAAMSAAKSRIEIIKDEFDFRKQRCPVHHIDTRLKSADSILGKLQHKELDLTLTAACNNIYDIAGIRVVCPYIKDVYLIRDRIVAQDDITVLTEKDYIMNPKRNGYRSLHMIIRIPVYFMNKKQMVPVEFQIRTLAMDLWASLEHDIRYKSVHKSAEFDFTAKLYECSNMIYEAEAAMEKMNEVLEEP